VEKRGDDSVSYAPAYGYQYNENDKAKRGDDIVAYAPAYGYQYNDNDKEELKMKPASVLEIVVREKMFRDRT
jgi:hypothetical protein